MTKIGLLLVFVVAIAASMFVVQAASAVQETEPTSITIRVNIQSFTFAMPTGREPGPVYDRWYMTGEVRNEQGAKIADGRSPIFYISDTECWIDFVIRKYVPERGDRVSISLFAITYATGQFIDINASEPIPGLVFDPTGRCLDIAYIVGTEQEGYEAGGQGVLRDFDGELYYAIETLGLTSQEVTPPTDSDGDGWTDEQEKNAGTNPYSVDTDSDGIWDSQDSNPLAAAESAPVAQQPLIPGFEAIFAFACVLTLVYVLRRASRRT